SGHEKPVGRSGRVQLAKRSQYRVDQWRLRLEQQADCHRKPELGQGKPHGEVWRRMARRLVDVHQPGRLRTSQFQCRGNGAAISDLAGGGGVTIGFPYASFLLGAADSATIKPTSDPQVRKWAYSMYLQDTWKITHRLTLDYGIRWDLQN